MQNINFQDRLHSYPFVKPIDGFHNIVIDAVFLISKNFALPLKVTRIVIHEGLINFRITDKNNIYVGNFNYVGKEVIEMFPRTENCMGKLWVNTSLADALTSDTKILSTDFYLKTTKLIEQYNISKLNGLTGDIILQEEDFFKITVEEVNSTTDKLICSTTNVFPPKCDVKVPIQSINNVTPDIAGKIFLGSSNAALFVDKISESRIEVSSFYANVDFHKNALTGPQGRTGLPGPPGIPGAPGNVIDNTTSTLYAAYHNGITFKSLLSSLSSFKDLTKIISSGLTSTVIMGNGKIFYRFINPQDSPLIDKFKVLNYSVPPIDVDYSGSSIVVVGSVISRYSLFGNFISNITAPDADPVISIAGNIFDSTFYLATSSNVYKYNGVSLVGLVHTGGTIKKIKQVDQELYIIFTDGRVKTPSNLFTVTGDVADVYGDWAIGSNGLIAKLSTSGIQYISVTDKNLFGIDGFGSSHIFTVGDAGTVVFFDGDTWQIKPSIPLKNWKSITVPTITDAFLVGF